MNAILIHLRMLHKMSEVNGSSIFPLGIVPGIEAGIDSIIKLLILKCLRLNLPDSGLIQDLQGSTGNPSSSGNQNPLGTKVYLF